jgi:hypothetical protein
MTIFISPKNINSSLSDRASPIYYYKSFRISSFLQYQNPFPTLFDDFWMNQTTITLRVIKGLSDSSFFAHLKAHRSSFACKS